MQEPFLLHKATPVATDVAKWAAADPYLSLVSAGLPLDVLPSGATNSNVSFVTNAPGPITNAAKFNSTTSQLALANGPYQLNTSGDFCIEWWQNVNGASSIIASLWHPGTAARCAWCTNITPTVIGLSYNASFSLGVTSGVSIPNNAWSHIAITRAGGNAYKYFVNGAIVYTATLATVFQTGDLPFYLGYRGEAAGLPAGGYLAGFRVTKGTPRYTAPFTPSTVFY